MKKIQVFKEEKIERELSKEEFYSLFENAISKIAKKRIGREGKIVFENFSPIKIFVFGEDSLTKKFLKYMYCFAQKSIRATSVPCEAMNRYGFVAFDLEDCSFDDRKVLRSYWEAHKGISFVRTNMFSFGNSIGMFGDGIYVQLGYSNDGGILNF